MAIEIPNNVAQEMNVDHTIRSFALDRALQYKGSRPGDSKAESIVEMAKVFEGYLKNGAK